MSSGKKRRTQGERPVAGSVERSTFFRVILYTLFTVLVAFLVYTSSVLGNLASPNAIFVAVFLVLGLVVIFDVQHQHKVKNSRVTLLFGSMAVQLVMIHTVVVLVGGAGLEASYSLLLIPYLIAPLTNAVLLGRLSGMYTSYVVTLIGAMLMPVEFRFQYMVLSLLSGLTVVMLTRQVRRRSDILRAGFYASVIVLLLSVIFELVLVPSDGDLLREFGIKSLCVVGLSMLVTMVVGGILPVLESIFGITTSISWLEMSDLNHRLLRRMQLEVPGTFHHSLVVASLAETAAEEVGANAIQCRVCSYFHDIGKMKKPTYFIENQGDVNPHDSLTPSMSALIIIAHVKDGVDLAVKNKLNPMIIDVIREHHGDSLVYYFYHKAREARMQAEDKAGQGLENVEDLPDVNEENFRYPGPRPRTPESGIISLADCVESASRSLKKPTPAKIASLVDDIVNKRIAEGQLDDCGLTLRELQLVRASFAKTLRNMLHSRIDYPKEEERKQDAELRAAGRPSSLQVRVEDRPEAIEKMSGRQVVQAAKKDA